jgi:hypothetical protein
VSDGQHHPPALQVTGRRSTRVRIVEHEAQHFVIPQRHHGEGCVIVEITMAAETDVGFV